MKSVTNDYKEQLTTLGRQYKVLVTYTQNNQQIELSNSELNIVTPHYNGDILKSVMKQLDLDSNVDIPIGTEINCQFGLLVNNDYEYIDYGNYIVYSSEKQEDLKSYKIVCYDKMLYAMKDYEDLNVTYPLSVKNYLSAIATKLGLTLATQTFVNDDVEISSEKYLDENGGNLGYTYRDVLDDLAQVTASTICINEDDELEVRYLKNTKTKNLIINSARVNYTYDKNTNDIVSYTLQVDNIVKTLPVGTKLTLSYYLQRTGNYTELTTDYRKNRFGMHGNVNYTNTSSQSVTSYPFANYITSNNQGSRVSMTWTIPDNVATINSFALSVQIGCRPSDNNDDVWVFKEPQLEVGDKSTDYELNDNIVFNETYLKDTNVIFKEKYGPINSVVFSRSGDSDLIYRKDDTSIEENGLCELKIKDNQLLNDNDRDNFIDEIFDKLKGLEYYINDYTSTGITILELCDKYNIKIDDNIYNCVMLNDELNVTQGFEELIHTDEPETNVSDYKKADTTDRRINQAYIIVDKQNQEITALTSKTNNLATQVNNDKQELLNKFGDYALNSTITDLTTQVSNIQTDTYTKTEVSQILKGTFYDENNNQVVSEVVKTISGTFDANGMTYAKTNAKTSTTINEVGVRVNNTTSSDELLFAGYDDNISQTIVRTDNLLVRNYLNIGSNSRLQDYETGTGVFDI